MTVELFFVVPCGGDPWLAVLLHGLATLLHDLCVGSCHNPISTLFPRYILNGTVSLRINMNKG